MVSSMVMAWALGCSGKVFPTTTLDVGGHAVVAELAVDDEQRARGLMHRSRMAEDDGMLFLYPDSKPRSFWMKDTKIPLSIAFIDASGEIVKIADMQPLVTESTKSLYPAKYALEMNQGWFERHGVTKGAKVAGIPKDAEVGVK